VLKGKGEGTAIRLEEILLPMEQDGLTWLRKKVTRGRTQPRENSFSEARRKKWINVCEL